MIELTDEKSLKAIEKIADEKGVIPLGNVYYDDTKGIVAFDYKTCFNVDPNLELYYGKYNKVGYMDITKDKFNEYYSEEIL